MKPYITMRMFAMLFVATLLASANLFADYTFTYNGTDYELKTATATWANAAASAKAVGGKLVEINSEAEQAAIYTAIITNSGMNRTYVSVDDGGGATYVWIGGSDVTTEGTWLWDGTNSGTGTAFWSGQGGGGNDDGYAVNGAYNNWGYDADVCGGSTSCEPDDFGGQDGLGFCVNDGGWPLGAIGEWNDISAANELYYIVEYFEKADAPSDLIVTANKTDATIDLTWKDNSDNEDSFRIYRADGDEIVTFDVEKDVTEYSDITAKNGVIYTYYVVALLNDIESDLSNKSNGVLSIVIHAPMLSTVTLDNSPVNAVITWEDNSDNENGFCVYRTYNGNTVEFMAPANATSYVDYTVVNNKTYTYVVVARKNGIESTMSNEIEFTVKATTVAPSNLTYELTAEKFVALAWQDNSDDEVSFLISRMVGTEVVTFEVVANTTTFIDNTVVAGAVYAYSVQTVRTYTVNEETGGPTDVLLYSEPSNTIASGIVEIIIQGHSKELVECEGTENLSLYCTAITDIGIEPAYKWYLDGKLLAGETEHILTFEDFSFTVSGIYKCMAYYVLGEGKDAVTISKWTDDIAVYALTEPEITEQPKEITDAIIGQDYTFYARVHYRGLTPPLYQDDFQWYKVTNNDADTIAVANSNRIAGVNSSRMTISNLKSTDLCAKDEYYLLKVIGQCATIYSEPCIIAAEANVVFNVQPESVMVCPGSDVQFTVNAIAQGDYTVSYKWQQDAADIADGFKFNGTQTASLQIFDTEENDLADYTCIASIDGQTITSTSKPAVLVFKDLPETTPQGSTEITVLRETDVDFIVDYVQGTEPLTVEWTFNGEVIKTGNWSVYDGELLLQYSVDSAEINQSGEYICKLENECASSEVIFTLNVTKWNETNGVNENNTTLSLSEATPNPAVNTTTIRFTMAETANATLTMYDETGKAVDTLFDGIAQAGTTVITFNVHDHNLTSGVYFYTLETANGVTQNKLIISK